MKKKIAIIKSGFMEGYLSHFKTLCYENGIVLDIFDNDKNYKEYLKNYDYVLTDSHFLPFCCNIFHGHTPIYKVKLGTAFYRTLFLLTHIFNIIKRRNLFRSSAKIFVVSNIVKKDLIENFGIAPEKILVVYPGFFRQCDNDLKEIPKIDKNKTFNVAMSAQGFIAKGGYVMLDALRIFRKLYPDIKIHVNIIYPKHKTNLGVNLYIKLFGLSDCVSLFGRQEDMASYYENADCFVCPSLFEAFGRVVVEAMYAKRPVILGSKVGAVDVVQDGVNAFVFKSGKKAAYNLAQKIKYVYDNYNELDNLIESAYNLSQSFTWENFAKQLFDGLFEN